MSLFFLLPIAPLVLRTLTRLSHPLSFSNLFLSHSSVAEFATIIATLHDNQGNAPSSNQRPIRSFLPATPSSHPSPPPPSTPSSPPIMAASLKDLIPYFHGRDANDEGGQEDPAEFIENLNFAVDGQVYTDQNRKLTATRVIFRTHLRDKALLWYHGLNAETRANWQLLETAFLSQFTLTAPKEVDPTWFLNLALNLRQRCRSIVKYIREGDQFNAKCPEKFRDVLGHQFTAGLDDKGKIDLVQVYLGAGKGTVTYAEAKQAVGRAYQRFGEPSPLDELNSPPTSPFPTPTPTVQSELVALLQALRIPQAPVPRENASSRQNYPPRDQLTRATFYRGIYCHNCREEGHYSTSCTRPAVSGAQRKANKRGIDELQDASHPYPRRPGPELGPLPAPVAPAAVASNRKEREEPGGRRMNNIGGANVEILNGQLLIK